MIDNLQSTTENMGSELKTLKTQLEEIKIDGSEKENEI